MEGQLKDQNQLKFFFPKNQTEIQNCMQHNEIVKYYNEVNSALNIKETMKNFQESGQLIELCLSASRSHKIGGVVMKISLDYHSLVRKANLALYDFKSTTFQCIKNLYMASEFFKDDDDESKKLGCEMIADCNQTAIQMAQTSEQLQIQCQNLTDMTIQGLVDAQNEQYMKQEDKKRIDFIIEKNKQSEMILKKQKQDLEEAISNQKEEEENLQKKIDSNLKWQIASSVIQSIGSVCSVALQKVNPISILQGTYKIFKKLNKNEKDQNEKEKVEEECKLLPIVEQLSKILFENKLIELQISELNAQKQKAKDQNEEKEIEEKIISLKENLEIQKKIYNELKQLIASLQEQNKSDIENLQHQQMIAIEKRYQYMEEKRKAEVQLVESVNNLQISLDNNNQIQISINTLDLIITNLGKLKVTFENITIFWTQVYKECINLNANGENLVKIKNKKEKLLELLLDDAKQWIGLGKLLDEACKQMKLVSGQTDNILNNIPQLHESHSRFKQLAEQIQQNKLQKIQEF